MDIFEELGLGKTGIFLLSGMLFWGLKRTMDYFLKYYIENYANTILERSKNKIARGMSAYEFLINKEFEYYQKIDCEYATLIVDIQDIKYNAISSKINKNIKQRAADYKDILLRIIKQIFVLKNICLMYQSYIPDNIYNSSTNVVVVIQNNLEKMYSVATDLCSERTIDEERISMVVEDVLMAIAIANLDIKNRLKDLANVGEDS